MIESGSIKRKKKNPNDPARFIQKVSVTDEGEMAENTVYGLDEEAISEEEKYDGLYAVCTDLLDDDVNGILKISAGRWQI